MLQTGSGIVRPPAVERPPSGRSVVSVAGRIVTGVVGVLLLGYGLGTLPGAFENRSLAEELVRHGQVVTVTSVETFVTRHNAKGGDYLEVDDVRVRVPGAGDDGWVVLTGTQSPQLDDVPGWTGSWTDRWTPATAGSGYAPPLRVSVLQDGDEQSRAMAVTDLPDWAGPDQAVLSAVVAAMGATVLAALAISLRRGRRRATSLSGRPVRPGAPGRRTASPRDG